MTPIHLPHPNRPMGREEEDFWIRVAQYQLDLQDTEEARFCRTVVMRAFVEEGQKTPGFFERLIF